MKDLLAKYCHQRYPQIKKVQTVPLRLLKVIASLSGKKELKLAVAMFGYFEKVKEMGNPDEAVSLLGKPLTTFEKWLATKV